ncbi:MAG: NosD domain-containing protein [Candidatus Heimdallarchaeaceae archaeon]
MRTKSIAVIFLLMNSLAFNLTVDSASHSSYPERKEIPQINFESSVKPNDYAASYVSHPSIEILSDDHFSNYSFSGVGTELSPYIIENYNITTSNNSGILIQNTSKFFKIKNCVITAISTGISIKNITANTAIIENNICYSNFFVGIYTRDAPNTLIMNNTCNYNAYYGMRILDCEYSEIISNYCKKNSQGGITVENCASIEIKKNLVIENGYSAGIVVADSNQAIIENNTCIDNALHGIELRESSAAVISKNYVVNNNSCTGIWLQNSFDVTILNNTIFSDKTSISCKDSTNVQIQNNRLYYSGLKIDVDLLVDFSSYDIQDNLVNNKELGFFINLVYVKITEPLYGQLILVNCQGVVVKNQGIDYEFTGVTLHYCNSVILQQLHISSSVGFIRTWGIEIYDSEKINILENICKNGGWGIRLRNVKDSLLKSNLCENNYFGIYLSDSQNISLIDNTCLENERSGITLINSDYCDINFNHIEKNGNSYLYATGLGIEYGSGNNVVHHNIFIDNNYNGSPQAIDVGNANIWYDVNSQEGNFWSDYSGEGPYLIYGYSNSTDPYPLSKIPVYSDFNYKNFYYFFLVLEFLKEIRID